MNNNLIIAAVLSFCACSITDPTPAPESPGTSVEQPTSPDAETLPASARLIPETVDSVEDVPGRYAQPFALPGQVSAITLAAPNFATGNYEVYRSCGVPICVREIGQYHIVPTNPAIGFAALSLVDSTGLVRSTYVLDLLWRDGDGNLVAIQLRQVLVNTTGPSQVWWRLPTDSPDEPTTPQRARRRTARARPPRYRRARRGHRLTRGNGRSSAQAAARGCVRALASGLRRHRRDHDRRKLADVEQHERGHVHDVVSVLPAVVPARIGKYELTLRNPTTGTGHLSLIPTGNPTQAHDYVVYAIWRAPDGTPSAIQLQRFDGVVPSARCSRCTASGGPAPARRPRHPRPRTRRRARPGLASPATTGSARSSAEWAHAGRYRRFTPRGRSTTKASPTTRAARPSRSGFATMRSPGQVLGMMASISRSKKKVPSVSIRARAVRRSGEGNERRSTCDSWYSSRRTRTPRPACCRRTRSSPRWASSTRSW